MEYDVLKIRAEEVRIVHDHYVAVLGIEAHYLIGADALAGIWKHGRWCDLLLQSFHHIRARLDRRKWTFPFSSKPSRLLR